MKKKWLSNLVLPLLVALLSATSSANQITVTHSLGTTTLDKTPTRIVVLGMDSLDVLDRLGIEPIGVVKSPMPAYLSKYQDSKYTPVGSLFEPDFEAIYNLKPDLIIVSNRSSTSFEELEKIAPSVLFISDWYNYWETTQDAWRMLGKIFSKQEQIEQHISAISSEIETIRSKTKGQKALTVLQSGGKISTFGAKSRYSSIYKLFGFSEAVDSVDATRHGQLISYEFIAETNPDYLLVLDRDRAIGRSDSINREEFDNPLINPLPVYKNDRIGFLTPAAWYISSSGITATELMVSDINRALSN
ncbi:siderophore ABC transporter substrate-binding protein [Vibrio sonorensis]|uniref:siderophore ABC transporter substrate-binding protein n=1 Tax=Vibrio sonorensis TaxID=1004316 RepID=UPI0008D9E3D1|nr:siderophore ABC transporter substrate-binding protein [Vibrio sonorensis]